MALGDRQRCLRSQLAADTLEVEAPPPISVAAPAPLSEGPALAGPSEVGLSDASPNGTDLSDIIILFI